MEELRIESGPRPLGQSGVLVSPIAYGMWRFAGTGLAEATAKVETALEAGLTLFDTADIYGIDGGGAFGDAETLFGAVLKAHPTLRGRLALATKFGIVPGTPHNSSASYIARAAEASLKRLKTETIDLYQIHRPDLLAHPAEIAAALSRLKDEGKIRAAGVSNQTPSQTAALQAFLPFPLASDQPEFSALAIAPLSDGTLDQCITRRMTPLAWSPLGGGRLVNGTGDTRALRVAAALDVIAARNGASRTAAALAWLMVHPSRPIPIIGTQNIERIAEAPAALAVTMTRAEWYAVLVASRGERLP